MRKILSVLIALTMLCSLIIPAATVTAADDLVGTDSMKVVGRKVGEQYQVSVYLYTVREAAGTTIRITSGGGLNVKTDEDGYPVLNVAVNKDVDFRPVTNQVRADGRIGLVYVADSSAGGGEYGPQFNGELIATYTYEITGDRDEASFIVDPTDVPVYYGVWDRKTESFPTYEFNVVYDLDPLSEPDTTTPPTETEEPDTTTPPTETAEPTSDTSFFPLPFLLSLPPSCLPSSVFSPYFFLSSFP